MSAEFGTLAEWTAQAARHEGPEHYIPAGCRGSGGPAAMDWLLKRLAPAPDERLLDVGGGVGGPAGYAREQRGVRPVLIEPELAACKAARALFGFEVLRADAAALPIRSGSFPKAWSLGVLCTTPDHLAVLRELRRVLRLKGRLGLVVYSAAQELDHQPAGNRFPPRGELADLLRTAGFEVTERISLDDLPGASEEWTSRQDAVQRRVEATHGRDPAWTQAAQQERKLGELLRSGNVVGEALVAQARR